MLPSSCYHPVPPPPNSKSYMKPCNALLSLFALQLTTSVEFLIQPSTHTVIMWVWSVYFVLQDKTFGLKNKKGKRQQQLIKQVTNQVKYGGTSIQKVISSHMIFNQSDFLIRITWECVLTMLLFIYSQRESADFQAKVSMLASFPGPAQLFVAPY